MPVFWLFIFQIIQGRKPLQIAFETGHQDIALILIDKGANLDWTDKSVSTTVFNFFNKKIMLNSSIHISYNQFLMYVKYFKSIRLQDIYHRCIYQMCQ